MKEGRQNTPSMRRHEYATRSGPPGGDTTGNKKTQIHTEGNKGQRLATYIPRQTRSHLSSEDRNKNKKNKAKHIKITFDAAAPVCSTSSMAHILPTTCQPGTLLLYLPCLPSPSRFFRHPRLPLFVKMDRWYRSIV